MATQTVREKMKITEHNAITNITTDRSMTADEVKQFNADKASGEALKAEAEARAIAKAALLEKLGITSEEAALLLS
jgi:hypothetical protein